jgi:hypothetical protein
MPNWTLPPHAADVIALFAFPHGADLSDDALFWRTYDDGRIKVFVNCSDTFEWGTADLEEIKPEDIELLQQCLDDLKEIDERYFLGELFAARKRNWRPAKFWLNAKDKRFDFNSRKLFEVLPEDPPKSEESSS